MLFLYYVVFGNHRIAVQNRQESGCKYLATCLSIRLFACTFHSFTLLACSTALIRSFAHSLSSLWERELLDVSISCCFDPQCIDFTFFPSSIILCFLFLFPLDEICDDKEPAIGFQFELRNVYLHIISLFLCCELFWGQIYLIVQSWSKHY